MLNHKTVAGERRVYSVKANFFDVKGYSDCVCKIAYNCYAANILY